MKHILLTGGCGFIGHHTVEHLLKNTDWIITILDRLTYAGNQNFLTDIDVWEKEKRRVRFVYHDFRSPFSLQTIHLLQVPDYIVHMGAETHVDRSIKDPMIFAETNVIGTINMLEFAKDVGPELFIYVSTDEVYGPTHRVEGGASLHVEGEPHRPSNPYSASKSGAEAFCYSYWNTYGLPIIITNTMNNFGERQNAEKFIPKTIKATLEGRPVTVHVKRNDLNKIVDVSSRCWLHARNHADALLFLMNRQRDIYGTPVFERYNVVGNWATVRQMAQRIADILGKPYIEDAVDFHAFRPGHDMHYGLDGSKLMKAGWTPPVSFEDSLINTVRWTYNNPQWLEG